MNETSDSDDFEQIGQHASQRLETGAFDEKMLTLVHSSLENVLQDLNAHFESHFLIISSIAAVIPKYSLQCQFTDLNPAVNFYVSLLSTSISDMRAVYLFIFFYYK